MQKEGKRSEDSDHRPSGVLLPPCFLELNVVDFLINDKNMCAVVGKNKNIEKILDFDLDMDKQITVKS